MTALPEAPKPPTPQTSARALARLAVDAALSKKALDVVVIDMRQVSGVADFFVVATGESDLQIRAISDAVQEDIREAVAEKPWKREGEQHLKWVVLDYVNVVVHIFHPERRTFYNLERLWGDAPREDVPDSATGADVKLLQEAEA